MSLRSDMGTETRMKYRASQLALWGRTVWAGKGAAGTKAQRQLRAGRRKWQAVRSGGNGARAAWSLCPVVSPVVTY